jgi:5-methylcytosine-specific restriction endonuclease McrA
MATRIIRRKDAIRLGLDWYFTGKPCRHGHIAKRTLSGNCFTCRVDWHRSEEHLAEVRKYYHDNREERLAYRKVHYEKNKHGSVAAYKKKNRKRIAAKRREYRQRNRKKIAAYNDAWARANRDKRALNERKRKARKVINGGSHTWDDIEALFIKQRALCAGCGESIEKKFHVDHKRPLSRGGSNGPRNLQLLCQPCNNQKHAKTMKEWNHP